MEKNLKKDDKKEVVEKVSSTSYSVARYVPNPDGTFSRRVSYVFTLTSPKYDSIVDRSNFSIDADRENARKSLLSGASLSDNAYDDPKKMPSELEVKIRSGKFDKAEISMIQKNLVQEVSDSVSETEKQQKKEKLEKINEARQAHLDKMVGFTSQPEKQ